MTSLLLKHTGTQTPHRHNYGRGYVLVPEFVSLVGSALRNPSAQTIDVLVRDDERAPTYWQTSMKVLLRRLLNLPNQQIHYIFDPHGPHDGFYHPLFDLVLRRHEDTAQYQLVKSDESAVRIVAEPRDTPTESVHLTELAKADDEKRYTFSVVYKASSPSARVLDKHQEYAMADELQRAQWQYVQSGDRRVFIQHGKVPPIGLRQAGDWRDIVSWPFPVEAEFRKVDGTVRKVTVPAGSVWMGTVWEPWAWPLIKNGTINGFSFGGMAKRRTNDGEGWFSLAARRRTR